MNSFSRTTDLLHRAMDVNTLRYQTTANNLANAEVPNFKRSEITFESELKKALDAEARMKTAFPLELTNERHIANNVAPDYREIQPRRALDYTSTVKANGNNVDAEEEAMNLLKIQLNYTLLTQMQAFEFNQALSVLR